MKKPEDMTPEEVREKIKKIKEGSKKEKCHYCLSDDFKEEIGEFKVLIEGELKRVHKECYNRHLNGESNLRIVIK